MKRTVITAAALAIAALAGCAPLRQLGTAGDGSLTLAPLAVRANPQVSVENGQIVVKPSILVYGNREGPVTITWRLPRDGKLRFARDGGVVVEGELLDRVIRDKDGRAQAIAVDPAQAVVVDCRVAEDRLTATCVNRNARSLVFKYTLRVFDGDTLLIRDPPIVNGSDM